MPVLKLKITGDVSLGGKRPGEVFTVKCDEGGVPLDIYWRRRLADEDNYGGGHITRLTDDAPVPDHAADGSAPAPRHLRKKG